MILRVLAHNWPLKALAVAVAAVTWFFVVSADRSQLGLTAPVEYVGLAPDMVMVGTPRETVDVQVEAARWAAARLTPASVRVRVDMARLREGDNVVALSAEHVDTPAGVSLRRVSPESVLIQLAQAAVKSVRVVPQIRGVPAPQHAMHRVLVDPATVQVRGPRTTIEDRAAVETVPVDVSGRRESVTETVGLLLPDSVYPTSQRTVQVTVEIRPEDTMRQRRSEGGR